MSYKNICTAERITTNTLEISTLTGVIPCLRKVFKISKTEALVFPTFNIPYAFQIKAKY